MNDASIRVADALHAGLIPWRMQHLPRHTLTGKVYGGVNPVLAQIAAARLGCSSPFWGTALEWRLLGGTVVQSPAEGVRLFPSGEEVFNWEQTDRRYEPPVLTYDDPALVFDDIVRNGGVNIEYGFDAICKYIGGEDRIRMPHKWMFEIGPGGVSGYYDAKGHELFHWSENRVHWDASPDVNELRAEIGTGYLGAVLNVRPLPRNLARHHDRHAPRWVGLMRSDPAMLVKVCENVTATVSWLLALAGRKVAWHCPARLNE